MLKVFGKLLLVYFKVQVGVATNFAPVDEYNPNPNAACLHRDLSDGDFVVAHKTFPCKSRVWIYNVRNGRSTIATVGDRGPVHADLDLNVPVTRKLRANGSEIVLYRLVNNGR